MLTINSKLKPQNSSDLFDTSYLTADLKGRSVRGGAITVVSQACKFILKTGSTVVLARILTPADFGLIAMVTAVTNFALMFRDLGLSSATVQRAEINHDQVSTLFWVNAALGVSVAAVVFALAPAVAWFYDDPRLTPVTMALATTFIFGGLTVQHQAMLQRHMRFLAIGVVEIVAMAIAVAVAIIAGLFGAGYWSLVFMHIALAVATAAGKWIAFPWLPGRPKRRIGTKKMLGFGGFITANSIVNYISRHLDHVLIGKLSGSVALGYYSRAYALLLLPLTQIRGPIGSVAIPALSRLQEDSVNYRLFYSQVIYFMSFFSMPVTAFLIVMSSQVIEIVLGEQWLAASSIFAILGIFGLVYTVWTSQGWLFVTTNQTHRMFRLGLVDGLLLIGSISVSAGHGPTAVAFAVTVCRLSLFIPSMWYASRGTPVTLRIILNAFRTPLLASLIMASAVFSLNTFLIYGFNPASQLFITFCVGIAVYFVACCMIEWSIEPILRLIKVVKILKKHKS